MATRAISGTIAHADSSPWVGATVTFELDRGAFTLDPDITFPLDGATAVTDSAGEFTVTLTSGLSVYWRCSLPDGDGFRFALADGAAVTLETLRASSEGLPIPVTSGAEILITDAAEDDIFLHNGTQFVNAPATALLDTDLGAELDSLYVAITDILITDGEDDEILLHNGTQFVNVPADTLLAGFVTDLDTLYVHTGAYNARGDLLVGGANDFYNTLPVGPDGTILAADSTEVSGVTWTPVGLYRPWVPPDLGASLNAWFKADQITGAVADTAVASWDDASGNGFTATQGTAGDRPIYRASRLNTLPGVDFVSTDALLSSLSASLSSETSYGVIDSDSAGTVAVFLGPSAAGGRQFYTVTGGALRVHLGSTFIGTTTAVIATDTPSVVGFTYAATTLSISVNGVIESFVHAETPTAARTTLIGTGGGAPWNGDIYELVCCDGLSASDALKLDGYLAHKWGTTALLPSTHPFKVAPPMVPTSGIVGLLDGVPAPSAIGGVAQIFVDASDGDLKCRFGDGTTKTIVTDT